MKRATEGAECDPCEPAPASGSENRNGTPGSTCRCGS